MGEHLDTLGSPEELRVNTACQRLMESFEHFQGPGGIEGVAACVKGKDRSSNQDYIGYKVHPGGIIIAVVADGMGGTDDGAAAGRCLRDGIMETPTSFWDGMETAQAKMREAGLKKNISIEGRTPGSCFAACKVHVDDSGEFSAVPFNAGDSRAAVIDPTGTVPHETQDHNFAARLLREGKLTPQKAKESPQRNRVYAAVYPHNILGAENLKTKEQEEPSRIRLKPGSILYIASDGVTHDVPPLRAGELLAQNNFDLEKTLEAISKETEGSTDNQSIVLLKIPEKSPPVSPETTKLTAEAATGVQKVLSGKKQ